MRVRRGGSDRLIYWFIASAVLLMLLLFDGRYIGRAAGSIPRNGYGRMIKAGGQWLVEAIWIQAQPGKRTFGEGDGDPYVGQADPDPSYRKCRAVKTFYQEHQYLAWYGNEETGQQSPGDEQLVAASGQGSGQGAEYTQGNMSGNTYTQGNAGRGGALGSGLQGGSGIMETPETLTGILNRPITGNTYVMEQLADYDFLMKHFYSVHTSTTVGRDLVNVKAPLERDMSMQGDHSKPQILIYHIHSQEAFADSGPGQTVVGVGGYLISLLEAKGYDVYHGTTVYDLKNGQLDHSKAYSYTLDRITNILQQNLSVEVVLDIHRDGVGENVHPVTQVDGKDTVQIMFFNELSQTPEGVIEYLQNPYHEDNLVFSPQMQLNAVAYYPRFTRKICLKGLWYNEYLRPKSSLIEMGVQNNTHQEALNAMEPLSGLLDMVLSKK